MSLLSSHMLVHKSLTAYDLYLTTLHTTDTRQRSLIRVADKTQGFKFEKGEYSWCEGDTGELGRVRSFGPH